MFEKSLIELLKADTGAGGLDSLLSTFDTEPAVFSSAAPEKAEMPYVIIDIQTFQTENLAARGFDIDVDIYDRSGSGAVMRQIAERVEFVCDRKVITGDNRFGHIRLFFEPGREVEKTDTGMRHYNCRLAARAGRSKWAGTL